MIYIFLIMHFEACLFVALEIDDEDSYLSNQSFIEHKSEDRDIYLMAIYVVQVTFTTVGFGDIHGCNRIEYMYFI